MKTFDLLLISIMALICGCSHFDHDSNSPVDLGSLEKLKISSDDKNQALSILGNPKRVYQSQSGETAWVYFDRVTGYQSATINFNKVGKLRAFTWLITSQPEMKLENAKARFPGGRFLMEDPPWLDPHIAPNERFYTEYKKGIRITLGKTRNEVESIGWFDPEDPPKKPKMEDYYFYQKDNGLVTIRPKKIEKWSEIEVAREVAREVASLSAKSK